LLVILNRFFIEFLIIFYRGGYNSECVKGYKGKLCS